MRSSKATKATVNSPEQRPEKKPTKSTKASSEPTKSHIIDRTEEALRQGITGFAIIGGVKQNKQDK